MLASRAVRWKFEFSVVRRRRPDAAGRHRAALGCGFEGWLEPVTAEAKVGLSPVQTQRGNDSCAKIAVVRLMARYAGDDSQPRN